MVDSGIPAIQWSIVVFQRYNGRYWYSSDTMVDSGIASDTMVDSGIASDTMVDSGDPAIQWLHKKRYQAHNTSIERGWVREVTKRGLGKKGKNKHKK